MSGFEDREKDFERKYAHDKTIDFNVEARCCKLFGLWAAEKLGLSGQAALDYALEVVNANLEDPGFDDVLRKVGGDFNAKGVTCSDHMMKVELEKALDEARRQILKEGK